MIYCNTGDFGVLDQGDRNPDTAYLIDGGVEERREEAYYFDNGERPGYGGFLFQYTLEGKGFFEKQGIVHELLPGMGFLVQFPEDSRYYLQKGKGQAWKFLFLHFGGEGARAFAAQLEKDTGGVFALAPGSKAVRMALKLQEEMCSGCLLKKYEGTEFVYSFLCTFLREIEAGEENAGNSAVSRTKAILEKEYMKIQSIQEAAERVGLSKEHLGRLFKKEMKITPGQYLLNLKLRQAMSDLLNTDKTLEKIAVENGFSNGNYFGKVFKKRTGVTPLQYRSRK